MRETGEIWGSGYQFPFCDGRCHDNVNRRAVPREGDRIRQETGRTLLPKTRLACFADWRKVTTRLADNEEWLAHNAGNIEHSPTHDSAMGERGE